MDIEAVVKITLAVLDNHFCYSGAKQWKDYDPMEKQTLALKIASQVLLAAARKGK